MLRHSTLSFAIVMKWKVIITSIFDDDDDDELDASSHN